MFAFACVREFMCFNPSGVRRRLTFSNIKSRENGIICFQTLILQIRLLSTFCHTGSTYPFLNVVIAVV